VVISPGSQKSQWVSYEIGFAQGHGLTIIPFLTHPKLDPFPFIRDLKYTTSADELITYLQKVMAEGPMGKSHLDALRDPDNDAVALAARLGHKEVIVGKVIEIWAHHSLESMLPLTKLGIEPHRLRFSDPVQKQFTDVLRRCGGLREFPPPNQRKFGIAKLPIGTTDDEGLNVDLFETDWNTWMSSRTVIERDTELRHELSHVLPERNCLPQSMSLQFIIRFANGDVLAMKRKDGLASSPNSWSFSAEEQLHERDFHYGSASAAEQLFRRAFIEEVFGRREGDAEFFKRIWADDCSQLVRSHRIWSFFLEENVGIHQLFGMYQLSVQPRDLRRIHEMAVSSGWGTTDPEGYWYVAPESEARSLLQSGRCYVERLHGDPERRLIKSEGLHPTSRYRLWRLYLALNRRPQTLASVAQTR